jgi:hypothetical protein
MRFGLSLAPVAGPWQVRGGFGSFRHGSDAEAVPEWFPGFSTAHLRQSAWLAQALR